MSADFTDIGIVDLDLKKTTWSRVHSSMRTLYLGLSREPDLAWIRFFHEERESRIVIKRHGLWIEDSYIVFDCLLPDVETHHLPDFRASIDYANRKSRELVAARREQSEQQQHSTRAEQRRLAELRARIRSAGQSSETMARAAAPETIIEPGPAESSVDAANGSAGFDSKRNEWRARFRAALTTRAKEPDRGND
ncbi:MAG TPA: hypothetical protein VFI49_15195 [Rudaea sp.]|nr:hypothetical protein [Rudaea sp.]